MIMGDEAAPTVFFFIKKNHMGIYCVEVTIIAAVMRRSKLEVDDIN